MPDEAYGFVTTDDPEEKELADAAMICRACNAFDGTHYGEPLDADLYVFALDGAGKMKAVLAAYCMGGTFEGRPVTEAAAFTLPEARRQGLFGAMLEALKEEPEGAAPAGEPQADRDRQMPAAAKRRQILPIRKETVCFDMALLCDFCYDNINTWNKADREYPLFNSIADFCCRRWKR